ncbi:LolA family protein [Azospirillum sp. sgz302134]
MTRFILALVAVLALASPVLAAPPEPATLGEGQVLRGRFVQERHLKGFQAPLKSEGRFTLVPGRGLLWRTETPFAVTTVMSPSGLVQEVRGAETMRMPASKLPFLSRLYAMLGGALGGDLKALEGMFTVARERDANGWRLVLTPLKADDPAMPIRSITLTGARLVEAVEITKPDGDFDRLRFLDQSLTAGPPAPDEAQLLGAPERP